MGLSPILKTNNKFIEQNGGNSMDSIILNNGIKMPQIGLGVFQIADQNICEESVLTARELPRLIEDGASCFNHYSLSTT